eukprot:3611691-Prymnesium_polylepis.1
MGEGGVARMGEVLRDHAKRYSRGAGLAGAGSHGGVRSTGVGTKVRRTVYAGPRDEASAYKHTTPAGTAQRGNMRRQLAKTVL